MKKQLVFDIDEILRETPPAIIGDKMKHIEILRNELKKYFYLWNTSTGAQVCDPDGNAYIFTTREQAEQFAENNEL